VRKCENTRTESHGAHHQTILVGEPSNIIGSGVREKIILLCFSGLLRMSVWNPDNFGYLAEVGV
jgi:hypothetical protein